MMQLKNELNSEKKKAQNEMLKAQMEKIQMEKDLLKKQAEEVIKKREDSAKRARETATPVPKKSKKIDKPPIPMTPLLKSGGKMDNIEPKQQIEKSEEGKEQVI